ncbi:MAG: NADP-dependent malic enzyme [Rickettsiaceae bacterium]|nr:NADP-dependent malic enzyme [Rickettsiaceae bacterium]
MKKDRSLAQEALEYHKQNNHPGKIAIIPTKPLLSQHDLSLAYSPGVAAPCLEIEKRPEAIYEYTSKGNMVAVISNGTAVLGLGNLGAAASKPVMEGKSVLFKKFADVDSIDLEVSTEDPTEFINVVKHLGASFGGINLEDIKAPECFIIEDELKKIMDIPVFHDDQHGTAIITAAALINACHITNRKIEDIKIVVNGAGAASIACVELMKKMGVSKHNVAICDTKGVIYEGRTDGMNKWKEKHAIKTDKRTLEEAMKDADVFIGLSVKGAVTEKMVTAMAKNPIIFAMANPDPEITPEEVLSVRKDAIVATGRSDYNNQVNNVMGFPYIFRGALDVRASVINDEMKIAAANAIAELARQPVPNEVSSAYSGRKMQYGPEYIIPAPFDPRLITTVPIAVAKAAIESGVARKKDIDFKKYKAELEGRLNSKSNFMNVVFDKMHSNPKRIVFAEGEEEETIKAAIMLKDEGYGYPILVGKEDKITSIAENFGSEEDLEGIEIVNSTKDSVTTDKYINYLYNRLQRKGYLYRDCARLIKNDRTIFAACIVACGDADAVVAGGTKSYQTCLGDIMKVIDEKPGHIVFGYSVLISKLSNVIIADSSVHEIPSSEELADITTQAANIAASLNYTPRAALLSFSTFGNPSRDITSRIRNAVKILESRNVDFEYDGEMSPEVALNKNLMKLYPFCRLSGPANILVMPGLHSAAISTQLLQEFAAGVFIGPIIAGLKHPVQIVHMGASASEILNFAALTTLH